jgi:hypothetical protein
MRRISSPQWFLFVLRGLRRPTGEASRTVDPPRGSIALESLKPLSQPRGLIGRVSLTSSSEARSNRPFIP